MTKKALLVGINYTSVPSCTLKGCIDDVVNMANVLMLHYGYTASNIVILRDDATSPELMPTFKNITANMKALAAASGSCSDVWVHYSGHGSQINLNLGSAGTVLEDVIIPVDFTSAGVITADMMNAFLRGIACRAMVLMDCCHSASLCELEWSFQYVSGASFMRTHNPTRSIANPNLFYISGCMDNQTSDDIYDNVAKQYEGAFTDAVLTSLAQNNYTVSIGRLLQGIYGWLNANKFTQRPIFSSSSSSPNFTLTSVVPTGVVTTLSIPASKVVKNNFKSLVFGV